MSSFDLEITINLACAGGIFAHDVEGIATIDYEPDGDGGFHGWSMTDIRFPNVVGDITKDHWLWPLFKDAVDVETAFVEAAIRNHIDDDDGSDEAYESRRDSAPAYQPSL
jgi:hypothetical protein